MVKKCVGKTKSICCDGKVSSMVDEDAILFVDEPFADRIQKLEEKVKKLEKSATFKKTKETRKSKTEILTSFSKSRNLIFRISSE